MANRDLMAVFLNGVAQLEYDRKKPLSEFQTDYLVNMDNKMDAGIQLGEEVLDNPEVVERVKFVAGNLLHAMKSNDESSCAAFCAYMATRMPDLKQVKMADLNHEVPIELVLDQEYRRPVSIPVTTLNG